jgi:nucleoid-associated protein YgaU
VTATRKLFIAALLLAAGFGVARLMGQPVALRYISHLGGPVAPQSAAEEPKHASAAPPLALAPNGARLVPDYAAAIPYQVRAVAPANEPAAPSTTRHDPGVIAAPSLAASVADPLAVSKFAPRVKLRDEAPRPLDIELRSPSVVYAPPVLPQPPTDAPAAGENRSASADWRTSGLSPAGFVQDTNVATINASYSPSAKLSDAAFKVVPPPWPVPEETSEKRTHIVVDGDSLERLAGRYLDDPTRGNDIYEANRELLANPDLLPIGVELVIPKRGTRLSFDESLPQSAVANDSPLRAASHRGLVPIRPIPTSSNVVPRAQLLRPVAAE